LFGLLTSIISGAAETFAVFKSTDHGRAWIRADSGMAGHARINAFGMADGVLFAGTDAGIFTSSDQALSWKKAEGEAMPARVLSFAALGKKMFAGIDSKGLLVSTNGGRSWELDARLRARKVRCLLRQNGKLFAGTDAEGVFSSDDAGQTWNRQSAGLPPRSQVFALSIASGKLFAALYSQGLYRWDDEEKSWGKIEGVTPLALASMNDTLVAGHNPGGLYWSANAGTSWFKAVAEEPRRFTLLPTESLSELWDRAPAWALEASEGLVLAGASSGIFFSEDNGRTWTRAHEGLPAESPGLAFLVTRNFVLASTRIE
jgi:photosystem II stability/assembly factor-like uncharacterized protein